MKLSRKTKMIRITEIFLIAIMNLSRICLVALAQRKISNISNTNKKQNLDYK